MQIYSICHLKICKISIYKSPQCKNTDDRYLNPFVLLLVPRYFCILLASLCHELREILFFGFGHCFGLFQTVIVVEVNKVGQVGLTFILTIRAPP